MQINDNQKYLIYGLLACLVIGGVWYLFCGAGRYSNNTDERLSAAEEQLSQLKAELRETRSAIDSAKGTAEQITGTAESIDRGLGEAAANASDGAAASRSAENAMRDAQSTTDACAEIVSDSRKRLDECAAVFDRIERSNQSGTSGGTNKGNNP